MDLESLDALYVGEKEDDYQYVKNIISELKIDNLDVSWAHHFDEGVEYIEKNEPDLVLANYHLGERNGLDFLSEIRKGECVKPILLLSDKYDEEAENESVRVGAETYLEKNPDSPHYLKNAIIRAIERSQALSAIQRSESRMRGIFLWSSVGIALFDMDRLLVQSNPAFSNLIGFTIEQLCAMDIANDFADPKDAEALEKKFAKVAQNKKPVAMTQARFQKKNGDWIWVQLTFSAFSETGTEPQFIISLIEDITEKKQAEIALEHSQEKLSRLSKDLISAQEDERRSVVLELHDVIGGNLGAVKYLLEKLKLDHNTLDEPCINFFTQIDNLIVDTIDEVQRLSTSLRPPMLDDLGIITTLEWLVRQHNEIYSDITTSLTIDIDEKIIPQDLKIVLFRITQESLNNAAKHSQGEEITVSLIGSEKKILLTINDNGVGFDTDILDAVDGDFGLGLRNMYKRTELSKGKMLFATETGEGTTVHAEWDRNHIKQEEESTPS